VNSRVGNGATGAAVIVLSDVDLAPSLATLTKTDIVVENIGVSTT
jgi:hypothetical protein